MKGEKRLRTARAFTLVEAVISVFIVSVMFVAALSMVGAARLGEYKVAESFRGALLAQDLMAEILQQPYEDPNGSAVFGVESGEGTTNRTDFDDVDDYHGWSKSPPNNKDGSAISIPDNDAWERSVQVSWVDPSDLSQTVGSDQGVKRIAVTVTHDDVPVTSVNACRTSVWLGVGDG